MTPFLVFLLLTLNIFHTVFSVSIDDFEQVNVSWFTIFRENNSFLKIKNAWSYHRIIIRTCVYNTFYSSMVLH